MEGVDSTPQLESAFAEIFSLSLPTRLQLSVKYYDQYQATKDVKHLHKSILINEYSLLEEVKENSNHSESSANSLLRIIARSYHCLYDNTRNPFHLRRAVEVLGRLVTIPGSSAVIATDSGEPLQGGVEVNQGPAKSLDNSQIEVVAELSAMQRKLWEATKKEKYLRHAIASAEYWLLLTSRVEPISTTPVKNVAPVMQKEVVNVGKTEIDSQRYTILRDAMLWVIEFQEHHLASLKKGADNSVFMTLIARHIIALTASFTKGELKGEVFSNMAPKVLWEMGKRLSTWYAEYCNTRDAKRCLEVGMAMFKYAVDLEAKKAEQQRFLINWRILNTLRRRRFGDDGEEYSLGVLDVSISWNAHREAMAKFAEYRHFGAKLQEAEKSKLLEEAIFLCRKALSIGRRVLLEKNPLFDRPSIDDWMRNFGEMVLEKLQRCIGEEREDECQKITKLVEEELEYNRGEGIFNINPQASTLNLVILARVLFMLYRQNPDGRGAGDQDLLKIATKHAKDALEIVRSRLPAGHRGVQTERAAWNALSTFYIAEHERTGKIDILNKAITQMTKSIMTQKPYQDQELTGRVVVRFKSIAGLFLFLEDLKTLAAAHVQRFRNTGDYTDLQKAIDYQKTVVKYSMADRVMRAGYQVRLSEYLKVQVDSGRVSKKEDREVLLQEAIRLAEEAWEVLETDGDVHMKAECLLSLTSALQGRYMLDKKKNSENRDSAIKKLRVLLRGEKKKDGLVGLDKARLLNKLSKIYESSDLDDPQEKHEMERLAAAAAKEAFDACPPGLRFLQAEYLYDKARLDTNTDEALTAFKDCFNNESALPATRLRAAVAACRLLKEPGIERWEELYNLASEAMKVFSLLPIRSISPQDQQKTLEDFSGFGSMAAAAALEAKKSPADALVILEQGRDIIARQKFDTRVDITALRRKHPDLAGEFEKFRDRLDSPRVSTRSMNTGRLNDKIRDFGGKLSRANEGLMEVIKKIRSIEEFSRFLEPPDVAELKAAAGEGQSTIVVINVAQWRCDAFLVRNSPDSIKSKLLPGVNQDQINKKLGLDKTRSEIQPEATETTLSADFLDYLWREVTEPILLELGHKEDLPEPPEGLKLKALDSYPRVWWCPTGNASRLPLHAASSKLRNQKNSVMRRVVSSYTSSIKALIFTRSQVSRRRGISIESLGRTAILCSVRSTNLKDTGTWGPLKDLENAPREIDHVMEIIKETSAKNAHTGNNSTTNTLRTLQVSDPTEETLVYSLFPPHSPPDQHYPALFHFAGHGYSDPTDPSRSCLITTNSPLEVSELVALKLYEKAPILAYLSACSTGVNLSGNDGVGALTDEGIHVMGAMQLVGFLGVIGALWKVEDSTSLRVAKLVYTAWLSGAGPAHVPDFAWENHEALARCLHYTVMALRNSISEFEGDPKKKVSFTRCFILSHKHAS